jgi:hypothetical protein
MSLFIIKTWPSEGKGGEICPQGKIAEVDRNGLTREAAIVIREEIDADDRANGFGINEEEYANFLRGLESLPWRNQLEFDFGQGIEEGIKQAAE